MITLLLAIALQDSLLTEGDAVKVEDTKFEPTKLKTGDVRRLRDAEAWKAFWAEHSAAKDAKAPAVDLKKHMAVVIVVDTVMGCLSPKLDGVEVRETKEALRVIPSVTPGGCNNDMHGHPLGRGRSAIIVVMPRGVKKVEFVEKPREGKPRIGKTIDAVKE
jgi:hypothetical protein